MNIPTIVVPPRIVLFAAGAASVLLSVWHFATRSALAADPARATHDLNGLSMLFAGVVTVAVAWMAVSPKLLSAYAALYGIYYAGYAWILLFSRISWQQAALCLLLAVASLFAATNAWRESQPTPGTHPDG